MQGCNGRGKKDFSSVHEAAREVSFKVAIACCIAWCAVVLVQESPQYFLSGACTACTDSSHPLSQR
jgi:hypothetical protein